MATVFYKHKAFVVFTLVVGFIYICLHSKWPSGISALDITTMFRATKFRSTDFHPLDIIIDKRQAEIPFNISSMRLSSYRDGVEIQGKQFNISRNFLREVHFPLKDFVTLDTKILKEFELVTVVSDNHVTELTGLIASVQKHLPHKTLHVYDLGLSRENLHMLSSYCGVIVEPFDFRKYPEHVRNLSTYGFKAAVVHDAIRRYPGVFYLDACQYLTKSDLTQVFNLIVNTTRGYSSCSLTSHTIVSFTHTDMFEYFLTDAARIKSLTMVESGCYLLYRTRQMYDMIIPWFLCGMDKDCISPKYSRQRCGVKAQMQATTNDTNILGCHRYDQSALNLALARTYGYQQYFGFAQRARWISPVKCLRGRRLVNALMDNNTEC